MEWSSRKPLECLEEDRNKGMDVLGCIFGCFDCFPMISVGETNADAIKETFSLKDYRVKRKCDYGWSKKKTFASAVHE